MYDLERMDPGYLQNNLREYRDHPTCVAGAA